MTEHVFDVLLALAPGGGVSDPEEDLYSDLQDDCLLGRIVADLEATPFGAESPEILLLYKGASAACRAAFYHEPEQWSDAAAAVENLRGVTFSCLSLVVHNFLTELVAAHLAEPTMVFIRDPDGGRSHACPRIMEVEPARGSGLGGYLTRPVGDNLVAGQVVHFGDEVTTLRNDGDYLAVEVPPAPSDAAWVEGEFEVSVWVEGWFKGAIGQAIFVYLEDPRRTGPSRAPPSMTDLPPTEPSTGESPTNGDEDDGAVSENSPSTQSAAGEPGSTVPPND